MLDPAELTSTQRGAFVIWWLAVGGLRLTTAEYADRLGISHSGAYHILCSLSQVFGLYQDKQGRWRLVDNCVEIETR